MTLADMVAEVYTITGRPDLVAETSQAVRKATLRAHRSDNYYRDLVESAIVFSATDFTQAFEYKLTFPRWRSLKYFRHYDPVTATPGRFIDVIDPLDAVNQYGTTRAEVCYPAGVVFNIRALLQFNTLLVGYYQDPDISVLGYSSWVADEHPFLIANTSAADVFKIIGKDEESARMDAMSIALLHDLKASSLIPIGY
jgi:hypothetical protein